MGWSEFRPTGLTHRDERSFEGYTLITPIGGRSTYLIDHQGRIVHGWTAPSFQPGYGYLLPGGRLLVRGQQLVDTEIGPGQPAGKADFLLEMDWAGNVVWQWEHYSFHHDMFRLPNGHTLVIVWEKLPPEMAARIKGGFPKDVYERLWADPEHVKFFMAGLGVGGRPRDLTGALSDAILEIDQKGQVVHHWPLWRHCDPETDIICGCESPHEWTHCNSIDWTGDGRILISLREFSTVMTVSWPEGKVLWKWGQERISHQHDATFTPQGNVLLFDNGTHHHSVPHTRVVEVDPRTDKIVWQYNPRVVFSFHSGHIGGCERLPNGNTLICEGQSGRLFEVTPAGQVCWEWISPFVLPFKGVLASMFFRAHRYAADSPELKGMRFQPENYDLLNRELSLKK